MRYEIWKKNDFFYYGRQVVEMDVGVIEFADSIPLTWGSPFNLPLIGNVEDLRVEDDALTGEVKLFDWVQMDDEKIREMRAELHGYYKPVVKSDDGARVLKANLQSVFFEYFIGNPGATIKGK